MQGAAKSYMSKSVHFREHQMEKYLESTVRFLKEKIFMMIKIE